jgi:hypothetical protein
MACRGCFPDQLNFAVRATTRPFGIISLGTAEMLPGSVRPGLPADAGQPAVARAFLDFIAGQWCHCPAPPGGSRLLVWTSGNGSRPGTWLGVGRSCGSPAIPGPAQIAELEATRKRMRDERNAGSCESADDAE